MIRSHFGLELNPFDSAQKAALLPHQRDTPSLTMTQSG